MHVSLSEFKNIKAFTFTHSNMDVNDLGSYVLPDIEQFLPALKATFGIEELYYLATCNRILFILKMEEDLNQDFIEKMYQFVYPENNLNFSTVEMMSGADAIHHIFSVASSTQSLVVGEREIIRQIREAYDSCHEIGVTGDCIRLLIEHTVQVAKLVYSNTKIGEKQVSVVSLAFKRMLETNADRNQKVLLVGAGQTNSLVAKFLKKYGFSNVHCYNRTAEKAHNLAAQFDGVSGSLNELSEVEDFDIAIVCTASKTPVLTTELFDRIKRNKTVPSTLVDLSVPNNIEKDLTNRDGVELIDIEQLREMAAANMEFRKQEVIKAERLIGQRVLEFADVFKQRKVERSLTGHVPQEIKAVKKRAIEKVYNKELEALDPKTKALVLDMMDYMEKKCISIPFKLAKSQV